MATFRQKFNKKYGYDKDESHSIADIAKITGIKKSIIQEAYNRGSGAWESNPTSVRSKEGNKREGGYAPSKRMSKEAWSFGRSYGLVMNNRKQTGKGKPDRDLWEKIMKSDFSVIYNGILKNVKNARS